jgi:hypothetical protein
MRYVIVIEPLMPRAGEPAVEVRLQQLLRIALKGMRLQCVSVEKVAPATAEKLLDNGMTSSK